MSPKRFISKGVISLCQRYVKLLLNDTVNRVIIYILYNRACENAWQGVNDEK